MFSRVLRPKNLLNVLLPVVKNFIYYILQLMDIIVCCCNYQRSMRLLSL